MSRKLRILVVDNNPDFVGLLQQIIGHFYKGVEVIVVDFLEEVDLRLAQRCTLILLDYHFGASRLSGVSWLSQVKEQLTQVPVIGMSSIQRELVARRFKDAGANAFWDKIDLEALREFIDRAMTS